MKEGFNIFMFFAMAFGMIVFAIRSDSARVALKELKQQAIDHGYAKHDEKTGAWMWVEKENGK